MRTGASAHVCMLICVFGLTGCDAASQLARWWAEQAQQGHGPDERDSGSQAAGEADAATLDAGQSAVAPSIQHAAQLAVREDGHAVVLDALGLQIVDLRDPEHLSVEGSYPLRADSSLYLAGSYVVLIAQGILGYSGARDDVHLQHSGNAVLSIDISDRAHPTLIDEFPLGIYTVSALRRGPEGSSLFVGNWDDSAGTSRSQLSRYDLREGQLVRSGALILSGHILQLEASLDWLVAAVASDSGSSFSVEAVDISGSGLGAASSTVDLPGNVFRAKIAVASERLRLVYDKPDSTGWTYPTIATFDLQQPLANGASGSCTLSGGGVSSMVAWLFSEHDAAFYWSGSDGLYGVSLNPEGTCLDRTSYAEGGDFSSYGLLESDEHRLLTLGRDALRLYDTTPGTPASASLLASAPLAVPYVASRYAQTILGRVPSPPSASSEQLIGASYHGTDPVGRFQLFAVAGDTLSARAVISDEGLPQGITRAGNALATISSNSLRTFDVGDTQAPRELCQLERPKAYEQLFRFGDYQAHNTLDPWWAEFYSSASPVPRYDYLQTFHVGDARLAAEIPLIDPEPWGQPSWQQAGDLLANINFHEDWALRTEIQVYDLSDPTQPRAAGRFYSEEIGVNYIYDAHAWQPSQTYVSIGRALIAVYWWSAPAMSGTFSFDVINLHDPDNPRLLRPAFTLPGDNFQADAYFVDGSKIYVTERSGDKLYGSAVELGDLEAPAQSARREVPGQFIGAGDSAVYTRTASDPYYTSTKFTLSRLEWGEQESQLTAARTWQKRRFGNFVLGQAGAEPQVIYLIHHPLPGYSDPPVPGSDPRANWATLEILDATTFETLSSMLVDLDADSPLLSGSTLEVGVGWAKLQIDVGDPTQPRVIGATL